MSSELIIEVPAIEVTQGEGRVLYSFAIDGKQLESFATISRIARPQGHAVDGYQRPEVLSHIAEIRQYIESDAPILPNAIVLAFDSRIVFEADEKRSGPFTRTGRLKLRIDLAWKEHEKPAFVVDGQQRIAAIREAKVSAFPICVTAFIAKDTQQQREQFILVNSTKPLSKSLIYELLPTTQMVLPDVLERRRFPSMLLNRLNYDPDSPLRLRIRTPTNPEGVIQDNSVLKMLEHSLSDGALYEYRTSDSGIDIEAMLVTVKNFWSAVSIVFNDAWSLPAKKSRLVHGAGIVSMGFLMDAIADRHHGDEPPHLFEFFLRDLRGMEKLCKWTHGYWEFGGSVTRKWNELQNTTKDIRLLTNFLLLQYRAFVASQNKGDA